MGGSPNSAGIGRRQFVRLAGSGIAVSALGLPLLLDACGSSAAPAASTSPASSAAAAGSSAAAGGSSAAAGGSAAASTGSSASAAAGAPATVKVSSDTILHGTSVEGISLPLYAPFNGSKPDLPGNADGLDAAWYKFPKDNLVQTVTAPPGDGSHVTSLAFLTLQAPPPMNQNVAWQAVNKALNVTLDINNVPAADYVLKLNTVLASSSLPDFIYNPTFVNSQGSIPNLEQFVQAKCADLTPYLSGDAAKAYPNLTHYSHYTWRSGVVGGKIYAIPVARPPVDALMMYRKDLFDKAGVTITGAPKDAADFRKMLEAVNNPKGNQWALSGVRPGAAFGLTSRSAFSAMFKTPNNWSLDASGKLTKDYETDQYKAGLAWLAETWKAGLWHPNTPSGGPGTTNNDFMAARYAVNPSAVWGQYVQLWDIESTIQPNGRIYPMHPFSVDGSKPVYLAGTGNFGYTHVAKQSSEARLKMLLGVANFFAAPFGSKEWLLNFYGVEGPDFTYDKAGSPQFTTKGRAELSIVWRYITSPPYALFDPVRAKEFADVCHAAEVAYMANLVLDPTIGLFSATGFSKGIVAETALLSGATDIVLGRRPISDWAGLLNTWRSAAGDTMRKEYLTAIDKAYKS